MKHTNHLIPKVVSIFATVALILTVVLIVPTLGASATEINSYDELKAALTSTADADLVLTDDIAISEQVTIGSGCTKMIDLNGFKLINRYKTDAASSTDRRVLIFKDGTAGSHGTLKITSSKEGGQVYDENAKYNSNGVFWLKNSSQLYLENISYNGKLESGINSYAEFNNCSLNFTEANAGNRVQFSISSDKCNFVFKKCNITNSVTQKNIQLQKNTAKLDIYDSTISNTFSGGQALNQQLGEVNLYNTNLSSINRAIDAYGSKSNYSKLNIVGGSIGSTTGGDTRAFFTEGYINATVKDCTIFAKDYAVRTFNNYNNLTFDNCTIGSTDSVKCTYAVYTYKATASNNVLTFNGGSISATGNAIQSHGSNDKVFLNDVAVTSTGEGAINSAENSTVFTINGGTFNAKNGFIFGCVNTSSINVEKGLFKGNTFGRNANHMANITFADGTKQFDAETGGNDITGAVTFDKKVVRVEAATAGDNVKVTYADDNGEISSSSVAKGNVTLGDYSGSVAKTFVGWSDGEKLYAAGDTYSVSADTTFTAMFIDLSTDDAAAVRWASDNNARGLKFTNRIDKALFDKLAALSAKDGKAVSVATVGTEISQDNTFAKKVTVSNNTESAGWYTDTTDAEYVYCGTASAYEIGREENLINTTMYARAYITVYYADGDSAVFYGNANAGRTMYDVAKAAYDNSTDEVQKAVLADYYGVK